MSPELFAEQFEALRPELLRYLTRLVLRPALAEELTQETAVRGLQHLEILPATANERRAWLFRVATNLGRDHCRRFGTLRETVMVDLRSMAENDPTFQAKTLSLRSSPESITIAREHLAACISCSLQRFPPEQAAALLLVEMMSFTVAETADILSARPAQVKGWLTTTRTATEEHYGRTCMLVNKQGVCYQCVELDQLYQANQGDPLAGTAKSLDDRLAILRTQPPARWTQLIAGLVDELVSPLPPGDRGRG
jgi:RNA polymerase sigma-70 factor, ECF subfamily